jgi:ATP-binding cassette subfamily C protein
VTARYEPLPVADASDARRAVLELARPRGLAVAAAAALLAATAAGLAVPAILGHIVDLVSDGRGADALIWPASLLLLAAVVQGTLTAVGQALVAQLGEGALAELRERVVERILKLPLERIERAGSGDLVSRVSDDVAEIARAVRQALPPMASSALLVGLTIVGLAALDWRLALAGLAAVPVQAHTLRWYLGRSAPVYSAERRAAAARAQQLLDSVSGAATVRAFGLGTEHAARVERRSLDSLEFTMRAVSLITRFFARLNVAELIGVAAILTTGFVLVRSGQITVGQATAAALYFIRLFDPINILLVLVDDAQRAGASLSRLVGIAEMEAPDEPSSPPRPADASVVLQGVRHAYIPGHDVLDGIDLEIGPGERVALIGVSGAGKTTLARVVAGIQRPDVGRILLGGIPIEALGRTAAARVVGLVSQEVHVFAGTLANDLRIADPSASSDELATALERVGALAWVRDLPDGLDTVVGDGGYQLTAERAQQLALARIVLADHPIVILDEATAESGSTGARALETAAAAALEGRTALVIAHRLTQAAAADRVIVLEGGRIVEQGAHADLVSGDGPYAALWSAWSDGRAA